MVSVDRSSDRSSERATAFGAYQVLNLVGLGGMAKVYRCVDTRTQKIVAVKVLPQAGRAEESALVRFEREIEAMRQLKHPYIVPLLDYSLSPDLSYLVMPYFEKGSVADRMMARLYSPREAERLLTHTAFALDYAHSQGYIHRDLKPSNLMLDEHEEAYLADFGLAKAIGTDRHAVEPWRLSGTAAYLAPELAEGGRADMRADVYALGIVLCEMLSGHRPFSSDNAIEYVHLHRRAVPPTPSQLNIDVPPQLDEVVSQALAKQPGDRPQSAGEFARLFKLAVDVMPDDLQWHVAKQRPRPTLMLMPVRSGTGALSGSRMSDPPTRPTRMDIDTQRMTKTTQNAVAPTPPAPEKPAKPAPRENAPPGRSNNNIVLVALAITALLVFIAVAVMTLNILARR